MSTRRADPPRGRRGCVGPQVRGCESEVCPRPTAAAHRRRPAGPLRMGARGRGWEPHAATAASRAARTGSSRAPPLGSRRQPLCPRGSPGHARHGPGNDGQGSCSWQSEHAARPLVGSGSRPDLGGPGMCRLEPQHARGLKGCSRIRVDVPQSIADRSATSRGRHASPLRA